MITYRVKYLADNGDGNPRSYNSEHPLTVGEVIQINSLYHHIREIITQKSGMRISVAQSAQSPEEAPSMPPYPKHNK